MGTKQIGSWVVVKNYSCIPQAPDMSLVYIPFCSSSISSSSYYYNDDTCYHYNYHHCHCHCHCHCRYHSRYRYHYHLLPLRLLRRRRLLLLLLRPLPLPLLLTTPTATAATTTTTTTTTQSILSQTSSHLRNLETHCYGRVPQNKVPLFSETPIFQVWRCPPNKPQTFNDTET